MNRNDSPVNIAALFENYIRIAAGNPGDTRAPSVSPLERLASTFGHDEGAVGVSSPGR